MSARTHSNLLTSIPDFVRRNKLISFGKTHTGTLYSCALAVTLMLKSEVLPPLDSILL